MFLPESPKLPLGAIWNADVSNHRSGVRLDSWPEASRFGRWFAPKPRLSNPVLALSITDSSATVNGLPVCRVTTPNVCQPLTIVDNKPRSASSARPFPNGSSYPYPSEKRLRTSKFDSPRSALVSWLFWGKFGSPALEKKLDASAIDFDQVYDARIERPKSSRCWNLACRLL